MQQQAALVAAHSAYLSPMATMAAVQMQHMAAINANGLIATPITPSSGRAGLAGTGGAGEPRQGGPGGAQGVAQKPLAPGGGRCRARGAGCALPSALAADWLSASARRLPALSVCLPVCRSLPPGTSTPPAIAATPVPAIPAALGVNGYSPVPAQPTGQPAPDALYPNGVHPYPGGGLCCPPGPGHRPSATVPFQAWGWL